MATTKEIVVRFDTTVLERQLRALAEVLSNVAIELREGAASIAAAATDDSDAARVGSLPEDQT
jgi:hypothetical protein